MILFFFSLIETSFHLKLFWVPIKYEYQYFCNKDVPWNKFVFLDNNPNRKVAVLSKVVLHIQSLHEFEENIDPAYYQSSLTSFLNYQDDICAQLVYLHKTYKKVTESSLINFLALRDLAIVSFEEQKELNEKVPDDKLFSFVIYGSLYTQRFISNFEKWCPQSEFEAETKIEAGLGVSDWQDFYHYIQKANESGNQAILQCESACLNETELFLYDHVYVACLISLCFPLILILKFFLFKLQRSFDGWLRLAFAVVFFYRNLMLCFVLNKRHTLSKVEILSFNFFEFANYLCWVLFFVTEKHLLMSFYDKELHFRLFKEFGSFASLYGLKIMFQIILRNYPGVTDAFLAIIFLFFNTILIAWLFIVSIKRYFEGKVVPGLDRKRMFASLVLSFIAFVFFNVTNIYTGIQDEHAIYNNEIIYIFTGTLLFFFKLYIDVAVREMKSKFK